MHFEVLLGTKRVTRQDGYDKVDALGWDDKEGMRQAADDEMDAPGRR